MSNTGALISYQRMMKVLPLFTKAIIENHADAEGWDPNEFYNEYPAYFEIRSSGWINVCAGEDYDVEYEFNSAEDFYQTILELEEKYK